MSTVETPLKYLWSAVFVDRHEINQPEDDRYSKHDDEAEHNPSAFRDVLEYMEDMPLLTFTLKGDGEIYATNLQTGEFAIVYHNGYSKFSLEDTPLTDRKVIFFRQVQQHTVGGETLPPQVARYILGYEGKNAQGETEKKVIYIDG